MRSSTKRKASYLVAVIIAAFTSVSAQADDTTGVAFFGFVLINTSLEPTKPIEEARLKMLDVFLQDALSASGRFKFITIPPELQKQIAAGAGMHNCNGCARDVANRIGADWAAWGTVQKVSNLILNVNQGPHPRSRSIPGDRPPDPLGRGTHRAAAARAARRVLCKVATA
jgi:uncharacterized protein DUF2380